MADGLVLPGKAPLIDRYGRQVTYLRLSVTSVSDASWARDLTN